MNCDKALRYAEYLLENNLISVASVERIKIIADYKQLRKRNKTEQDVVSLANKFNINPELLVVVTVERCEEILADYYCKSSKTIHNLIYNTN
jgi:hypothetical protein